jgi:hypothetical protein
MKYDEEEPFLVCSVHDGLSAGEGLVSERRFFVGYSDF